MLKIDPLSTLYVGIDLSSKSNYVTSSEIPVVYHKHIFFSLQENPGILFNTRRFCVIINTILEFYYHKYRKDFIMLYKTSIPGIPKKTLLPPCLSGSALKWIALFTMLIDHIGAVFLENGAIAAYNQQLSSAFSYEATLALYHADHVLRFLGRISFPIFCFLLVEGFVHTSNRKKYALRLFLFACISEIPFDVCFRREILELSYQNVMFTLLIGFLTLWIMDMVRQKNPVLMLLAAGGGILAGAVFAADYNWKGLVLILILYLFYSYPLEKTIAGCLSLLWEPAACLAFLPINLYNQQKGKSMKYFFYLFYPLHLFLLFLVRYAVFGI